MATVKTNVPENELIDMVTVDEVIPAWRGVGIIHLDIEGYEKEAITGAIRTVRRCRPDLIIETLPASNLVDGRWFADNVLSLGYKNVATLHDNLVYSCRET